MVLILGWYHRIALMDSLTIPKDIVKVAIRDALNAMILINVLSVVMILIWLKDKTLVIVFSNAQ